MEPTLPLGSHNNHRSHDPTAETNHFVSNNGPRYIFTPIAGAILVLLLLQRLNVLA